MIDNILHTEKLGRFTVQLWADYDTFGDANDWQDGARLVADGRDFYVLEKDEKSILDVIKYAPEKSMFHFVYYNQYSSASNPVLRRIEASYTLYDLAKEFFQKCENEQGQKQWLHDYNDMTKTEAIIEFFWQYVGKVDLPSDCIIVTQNKTKKEHVKNAENCLKDWETYFDGAYGFTVLDSEGDVLESVGGFYGLEYPIEDSSMAKEAREIAQSLENDAIKEDKDIQKEAKTGSVTMSTTLSDMMTSDNEQIKRLAKGIYKEITK